MPPPKPHCVQEHHARLTRGPGVHRGTACPRGHDHSRHEGMNLRRLIWCPTPKTMLRRGRSIPDRAPRVTEKGPPGERAGSPSINASLSDGGTGAVNPHLGLRVAFSASTDLAERSLLARFLASPAQGRPCSDFTVKMNRDARGLASPHSPALPGRLCVRRGQRVQCSGTPGAHNLKLSLFRACSTRTVWQKSARM